MSLEGNPVWQRFALSEPTAARTAASLYQPFIEQNPPIHLEQHPDWLTCLADNHRQTVVVYLLMTDRQVRGVTAFIHGPMQLRYRLGPVPLWQQGFHGYLARADPLFSASESPAAQRRHTTQLLALLASEMNADAAIFLEAVPVRGSVLQAQTDPQPQISPPPLQLVPYGQTQAHWSADLSGGLEAYLGRLGAKSRGDLRRTQRYFSATTDGKYTVKRFSSEAEIEAFLNDALPLSRKTHQYRNLGAGLRDPEQLEHRYRQAAHHGWFRSYILYARGEAIAFQAGCRSRSSYHAHEIGYDPAWAKSQPGIFLYTEIVRDLAMDGITRFDFGPTDNLHKRRLGTAATEEGYYYLFPRNLKGLARAWALSATLKLTALAKDAGMQLGLHSDKNKIQRPR